MGIFDRLFTKNTEAKNKLIRATYRLFGLNSAVYNINENPEAYVEEGYQKNLFVYACVEYITRKATAEVSYKLRRSKADGATEEIDKHPIIDLLKSPNKHQGWSEFWQQFLGFKLLTGNSYIYGVPKSETNKQLHEMHVLPSTAVEIVTGSNWDEPIGGYRLNYAPEKALEFTPNEILHIRYPNYDYLNGDYYGQSPLRAALGTLEKSNDNITASKSAFRNMGAAGIITDEGVSDAMGITEPQAKELEQRYQKKFGSPESKNKVLVTVGKLRWQQIGISPVDLNLIADHETSRRDIAMMYHLSSTLFNDTAGSTFNNIGEARKAAWTDAIIPEVKTALDELNRYIRAAYGDDTLEIYADYSAVEELQQNRSELSTWLAQAWWIKASRKQEIMGEDPDPEMDAYFVPQGLMPYEELPPLNLPNDSSGAQ